MEDLTAVVGEHDEDPQDPECERWNDEEVDRGELADMIIEEGAPGLRRWRTTTHQVLADRGFGDFDAELEQRLALKKERDRLWRLAHPETPGPRNPA